MAEDTTHDSYQDNLDLTSPTIHELQIDVLTVSSSKLLPTQITEITNVIIAHLQKHGKIMLMKATHLQPNSTSSNTPDG
jgi:hypothetical protein